MDYASKLLDLRWEHLPAEVQAQAKRCLKDILATAAGSLRLPNSDQTAELVAAEYGDGGVPMWFKGRGSSSTGAAYFNAQTVDSLDCHDGFRPNKGHCGATAVPVTIGACFGREGDLSGAELLTAVVVGYEIASRAGLAVHELYAPHYHASGTWAALGAAAGGARILGLPAEQIDLALGMAEYYAPAAPMLRCTEHPSIVKDAAGPAAWAGAMALAMASRGMPGLPSIFTAEEPGRRQIATFGNDWMIMRQYFKPYPTCRWTQPVVEGLKHLQAEQSFTAADVERVDVETFDCAAGLIAFPPEHTDAAQYSLPWAAAVYLVDGELGVEQIHPNRLTDFEVIEVGRRIFTHVVEDIQERFPREALARTVITLRNGTVLTSPTMSARGDHADPICKDEMDAKALGLTVPSLGGQKAGRLLEVVETLEDRPAADLLELL